MSMFFTSLAFVGPGGPEVLVVMLVLLLLFGAKDAPQIFRKINDMINSVRNTAEGFKREMLYGDATRPTSPNAVVINEDDELPPIEGSDDPIYQEGEEPGECDAASVMGMHEYETPVEDVEIIEEPIEEGSTELDETREEKHVSKA